MTYFTLREAVVVTWFVSWRLMIYGAIAGLTLSVTAALALVPFGISFARTMSYSHIPQMLGPLCVMPIILRELVRTQFRTFSLHIVRGEDPSTIAAEPQAQGSS